MKAIKNSIFYILIVLITLVITVAGKLLVRFVLEDSELVGLINTATFFILGAGIGLAVDISKSKRTGEIISIILLIPLVISLFLLNSAIDYHKLARDGFEITGFFKFYAYIAKISVFGMEVTEKQWIASIVNWIIRVFYLALSIFFVVWGYLWIRE